MCVSLELLLAVLSTQKPLPCSHQSLPHVKKLTFHHSK